MDSRCAFVEHEVRTRGSELTKLINRHAVGNDRAGIPGQDGFACACVQAHPRGAHCVRPNSRCVFVEHVSNQSFRAHQTNKPARGRF
jgi:hypothetical protein